MRLMVLAFNCLVYQPNQDGRKPHKDRSDASPRPFSAPPLATGTHGRCARGLPAATPPCLCHLRRSPPFVWSPPGAAVPTRPWPPSPASTGEATPRVPAGPLRLPSVAACPSRCGSPRTPPPAAPAPGRPWLSSSQPASLRRPSPRTLGYLWHCAATLPHARPPPAPGSPPSFSSRAARPRLVAPRRRPVSRPHLHRSSAMPGGSPSLASRDRSPTWPP